MKDVSRRIADPIEELLSSNLLVPDAYLLMAIGLLSASDDIPSMSVDSAKKPGKSWFHFGPKWRVDPRQPRPDVIAEELSFAVAGH